MAKEFGVPVQCQRFWLWAKRQNHTYRPNRPLTHQEEAQSVNAFIYKKNSFINFHVLYIYIYIYISLLLKVVKLEMALKTSGI